MNTKPFLSRVADTFMAALAALAILALISVVAVQAAPTTISRLFSGVTRFNGAILATPNGTANSDTNGFIRLISPNGSNSISWLTNGSEVWNFNGTLRTAYNGYVSGSATGLFWGGRYFGTQAVTSGTGLVF